MNPGRGPRRRVAGLGLAVAALALCVALPATLPTTAAWTDAAVVTATARAGTWPLPALSCRVPADPTKTCTATFGTAPFSLWPLFDYTRQVIVTTTSPTPVVWEVTLSPSAAAWPTSGATRLHDNQGRVDLVAASACSANPLWSMVRGSAGYQQVSSAATTSFEVRVPGWFGSGNDLLNC